MTTEERIAATNAKLAAINDELREMGRRMAAAIGEGKCR